MKIIASGKPSNKLIDGKKETVIPIINADGKNNGVGYYNPETKQGSVWGLLNHLNLFRAWRAMEIVQALPEIKRYSLSAAWYSANIDIRKDEIKYTQRLAELFPTQKRDIPNDQGVKRFHFSGLNPKLAIAPMLSFQSAAHKPILEDHPTQLYGLPLDLVSDLEILRNQLAKNSPSAAIVNRCLLEDSKENGGFHVINHDQLFRDIQKHNLQIVTPTNQLEPELPLPKIA